MNLTEIVTQLKQDQVVAYPTEAVFGLGCNPNSQTAVEKLLALKQNRFHQVLDPLHMKNLLVAFLCLADLLRKRYYLFLTFFLGLRFSYKNN